jgi:Xaa-Pro aminopeptidase
MSAQSPTLRALDGSDGILLVGASDRNPDLYYATRFLAPDPFAFVSTANESVMLVNDLELDRAKLQATVDSVRSRTRYVAKVRREKNREPQPHEVLLGMLREMELRQLLVPEGFPVGLADALRADGIVLDVVESPLFPQRALKSAAELDYLRDAMGAAERAMQAALEVLSAATAHDRKLYLDGEALTSEHLRRTIHRTLLDEEYVAERTIVACGDAACDPHQEGGGPLWADQPIVIDIFPKSSSHGYFGDITRTVVKGRATSELKKAYATVEAAQQLAFDAVRDGADGAAIHRSVLSFFTDSGYETGVRDGRNQGFFHGTGHGLGLEIHEAPRIGSSGDRLKSSQVVTVEPGLYYIGLGGVRIEDVVVVRDDGFENLTHFPKVLEV